MSTRIQIQLSVMMFIEFFIWGGWFVTMGIYLPNTLNATDPEIALAYSTQSWGAIIAPFIIGLIADRFFNAERILGVLHLIGAVLMYQISQAGSFGVFYPYILGYMILYMPTLALVNSVAFNQMDDPAKQFSFVRVFGTMGWIVAGMAISFIFHWDSPTGIANGALKYTFLMTSVASAFLGIFCFTLPKTPPRIGRSGRVRIADIIGLEALKLLKDRNFLVFFLASILISIPLAFYYQHAGQFLGEVNISNPAGKLSVGQISEMLFMLLLPYFFKRYGFKKTMIVAMLAWAVRYTLFSIGSSGEMVFILMVGIVLHGVCYDFFFVSGQIYTDSKAGLKYKSAAQGMITLATYGIGMLIGFWIAGKITDTYLTVDGGHFWDTIWLYPAGFAFLVMTLFTILFRNERISYEY